MALSAPIWHADETAATTRRDPPFLPGKTGDSRNVHQPGANRVDDELGSFVDAESVHDVSAVNGYGIGAEFEDRGNFLVRLAVNDHLKDFKLPRSEGGVAFAAQRGALLDFGIEDGFSGGNLANRNTEFQIESVLEDIALGPGVDGLAH